MTSRSGRPPIRASPTVNSRRSASGPGPSSRTPGGSTTASGSSTSRQRPGPRERGVVGRLRRRDRGHRPHHRQARVLAADHRGRSSTPVSDISFAQTGWMLVAQRTMGQRQLDRRAPVDDLRVRLPERHVGVAGHDLHRRRAPAVQRRRRGRPRLRAPTATCG
jgi:hypothetical protein